MNYFPEYVQLALSEIPSEISVAIPLNYCGHHCPGCHTTIYQDKDAGEFMLLDDLNKICEKYKGKASCVLFFNGEHDTERLLRMIKICKQFGFKVALYSGYELEELPIELVDMLDYYKVGSFKQELGGLAEPTTNQRLYSKDEGNITWKMQRR